MDKTVLITGASGGIGSAAARLFAQNGARVVLGAHRHFARAEALCAEIVAGGGSACALRADVTSEADVQRLFAEAESRFGPVDILVNNAGIAGQKLFTDLTLAEWHRMLDVHATGTFLCCRRALPAMVQKKVGAIVNVASMWGQVGAACEVHYSAAKAAVIGLTKALAKEMAPSGIRVNCVAPGAVATPMMADFTAEEQAELCAQVPLGRLGTPREVADTIFFLASPAAAYLTGQVLSPNGGMVV
ncbi:MAG: SDR family oxidoreductase [Oscillospiraceae bacterium]